MEYIDHIESENTGGGCLVDFVVLKDGRVIGINDEYLCIYKSMDSFWGDSSESLCIDLLKWETL